jgi:hypothetical protein
MDKIQRMRLIFCKYLYSIIEEKNIAIEDIVRLSDKSYAEVKRILDGLISPSLDDLMIIADLLNIHVTLTTEIPFGHKKAGMAIPLPPEKLGSKRFK